MGATPREERADVLVAVDPVGAQLVLQLALVALVAGAGSAARASGAMAGGRT